jgi:DNA-binding MarR family transcriptional regulator
MGDTTGLEHLVCFDLYAASRATTALYRRTLDTHGITYPQYVALRVLWHRGPTTVRDLGHALALDSGTLSPLLTRLQAQGLVRRERGTHDERTVWIHPTTKAADLRHHLADLPERLAAAVDLTRAEYAQLHHLLGRVRTAAATNHL